VVEQLFRLKLRLLGNAFRRSPWQLVGLLVGLVYGLGMAIVAVATLISLRLADVGFASRPVILFGAIIVIGFIVVPLVFGVDDVLDPRKFSLFGIPSGRLARSLAIAGLIGVPSLAMTLIALAQIVTWARGPLPVILAVIGVPLIVLTCLLCSRVSVSVGAFVLSSRRSRDTAGLLAFVALVLVTFAFVLLFRTDWQKHGLQIFTSLADAMGWSPFGAVWAAPADAAAGNVGAALAKELIAIVFVGLLWLAWHALVKLMLVTQPRAAEARSYHGLGFFKTARVTPASVIAERSITYWVRDARYHASLLVIPVVPFFLMAPLAIIGVPTHILALLPVPVMALFLGWSIHNDISYDHTAIWLHIASGTTGRDDRIGRLAPPLVVGVPLLLIASVICAPLYGDWGILPALIGVGFGVLCTGLGLSSIGSARFPYPAVRPGDSPFAAPQAVGSASAIIQSLSFFITFILASPTFVLAFIALFEPGFWSWGALLCGLVLGSLALWRGVVWGGEIFDRRAPEILGASVRN
jgi:ABC-2 type transport system permease protein